MEIDIPCYFLCPISMQLMKDPVTIPSGITYDRENIEKWLFICKNATCPVTKQPIPSPDLIPNHTLRRLIQGWCTLNALDRIPTPKPAVDRPQILKLLHEAENSPDSKLHCLRRLRSIAHRDDTSRLHLQAAAVGFLSAVVTGNSDAAARDEAVDILHKINPSDSDLKKLTAFNDVRFLDSLTQVMDNGSYQSRAHAVSLMRSAFSVADPDHLIGIRPEIFGHVARIIADDISAEATRSALKLLVEVCPWGRNRVKAVEGGAAGVLIEVLLGTKERRVCELALAALEQICRCAEGRAEVVRHGAGVAVVSKKILRVSNAASERAVKILGAIARHGASGRVVQEMLEVGVVAKLCLVLQVEASHRNKERAAEILRLHSRVWRNSSCIPSHLISSYPNS
ncbi:E3 ubiquitin-protein ligase PUB23-like [Salvia splendens]|uniref:E3 ubiquitin-protein ligase PUB23-like n=1 Tax=Salvia splendens TaxID=180675 RepID=UPI001C273664|nr:E3 ubiquitin-protein ligase PUB23-like [Salvia splendens]